MSGGGQGPEVPEEALWMARALELAGRGWGRVAPNPLVGAVIVRDGEVVGEGWHAEYGGAHAEVAALAAAGERARGATMYVSLEPCSHHGKTPPCTDAILAAGIRRVVFGASDPNPRARGGADVLRDAGVLAHGPTGGEAALDLNAPFFHAHSAVGAARPWIELKLALSLDGAMADGAGRSSWITGPEAREEVHRMRAGHDAIMVGIGTVLADDPLLTVRGAVAPRVPPTRVVLDRTLRLPLECRLLRTLEEAPVRVICGPHAPAPRVERLRGAGAEVFRATDLDEALRALREAGIRSVFCEGGPTLAGGVLAHGVVDRLSLFFAPLLLGGSGANPFAPLEARELAGAERWRRLRTRTFGPDTLISLAP